MRLLGCLVMVFCTHVTDENWLDKRFAVCHMVAMNATPFTATCQSFPFPFPFPFPKRRFCNEHL